MSHKVYLHKPLAPDDLLGRVEDDGRVYQSRPGPDRYVGRVDLRDGRIYQSMAGPDRYIGRVELDSGKVYTTRFGPDEYVGRVEADGDLRLHRPFARDPYLGRIADMPSYAHGAAALLLLVLPEIQALSAAEEGE